MLVIDILCLALILLILFLDIAPLRIILGLPFLFFFPGYTFIAALFPGKSDLGTIKRVILSLGFSIVTVPLIGLLLNYIWEIELYPTLILVAVFILVMSIIALYRRHSIPADEKFEILINLPLSKQERPSNLNMALYVILGVVIIGTIGTLGYAIASPKQGEKFTEFYITGLEGKIDGYPKEIILGEDGGVRLVKYLYHVKDTRGRIEDRLVDVEDTKARIAAGIVNHERQTVSYKISLIMDSTVAQVVSPIELAHGEEWKEEISFAPFNASATTKLTEDVYESEDPLVTDQQTIHVDSADQFKAGDYIRIGDEPSEIETINGDVILLCEPLVRYHKEGSEVIEMQKVELILGKYSEKWHQQGIEAETTVLHLWIVVKDGVEI